MALGQMREQLGEELTDQVRLEYLYVACNYAVFLEGADPAGCVGEVREALDATSDEGVAGYVAYLMELIEDTISIGPGGGKIDPEVASLEEDGA